MRILDGKFHLDGERVIKTSSGEEVPIDVEPVMLLRARDHLALPLLLAYRGLCVADECNDYQMVLLDARIAEFERFAREHPEQMKQPGVTRGAPWTAAGHQPADGGK